MRWGKRKNTQGSAKSVGLPVVPFQYGLFLFVCLSKWFTFLVRPSVTVRLHGRLLRLLLTFCGFAKKRISELKTFNIAQKLMRGRMFNDHFTRFFAKPLLAGRCSSLFVFRNSKSKVVNFKF